MSRTVGDMLKDALFHEGFLFTLKEDEFRVG